MEKTIAISDSVMEYVKEYGAMPYSVHITKQVVDEVIESLEKKTNHKIDRDQLTIFGIPVVINDSVDGWKLVDKLEGEDDAQRPDNRST